MERIYLTDNGIRRSPDLPDDSVSGCHVASLRQDEIRSVEGPGLLAQRPARQEERQSDGSEEHHDRRDDQCQQAATSWSGGWSGTVSRRNCGNGVRRRGTPRPS